MSEVDKAIPSKVVSKSKPKLPWISTKLRELIKAKRTAWEAFKKSLLRRRHRILLGKYVTVSLQPFVELSTSICSLSTATSD